LARRIDPGRRRSGLQQPKGEGVPGAKRVIWIILDAAGYELTRRCLEAGACPALAAMAREGHLGPTSPSEPNCQTPPALRALTAGTEPAENGIWGFRMPGGRGRPERSVSGFALPPRGAEPIWDVLERQGQGYALINTAFRRDRVWGRQARACDLLLDGYRNQRRRGGLLSLNGEAAPTRIPGTSFVLHPEEGGLGLRRRGRAAELLPPGAVREIRLGRRGKALIQWPGGKDCFVFPTTKARLRLSPRLRRAGIAVPRHILHGDIFRYARARLAPAPADEMEVPSRVSAQIGELALDLIRALPARLFMIYFSLIDELSHAYLDQIEESWPAGRGSEIARRSYALLDAYLGRIMEEADQRTLVAVSSDHGQAPFRRILRLNELFLEAGLVKSGGRGYDWRRSPAFYHPADCGQVVVNPGRVRRGGLSRETLLRRAVDCIEAANKGFDARIAYRIGEPPDPYLLFLYPRGDTYFTGKGRPGEGILDSERRGGHHLSPYCPSEWIRSLLALWSPGGLPATDGPGGQACQPPGRNTELKSYLLAWLGLPKNGS
jgi:hypothetical protein